MPKTSTHVSGVDVHLSPTSYQQSLNAPISVTIGGTTTSLPPAMDARRNMTKRLVLILTLILLAT